MRSSSHTLLKQKPSPGSPVGSSIGDHHRNFRTRKIGALRSFCGPRDFVDKVTFVEGLSITQAGESSYKNRLGRLPQLGFAAPRPERKNDAKTGKNSPSARLPEANGRAQDGPVEGFVRGFLSQYSPGEKAEKAQKRSPIFPKCRQVALENSPGLPQPAADTWCAVARGHDGFG